MGVKMNTLLPQKYLTINAFPRNLNCHTELSDNSVKWLSMPTITPLTTHTIMKDYSCMNESKYSGKTKHSLMGSNSQPTEPKNALYQLRHKF